MISYSKTIDEPLLLLPKSQQVYSINSFRDILIYCGDVEATESSRRHALYKLIKLALGKSRRLKDEICLMIIKQIRKNPNSESTDKAW